VKPIQGVTFAIECQWNDGKREAVNLTIPLKKLADWVGARTWSESKTVEVENND
jgi:hypothetical protein